MEEKERTITIDILENKFRAIYSYKRNPKDFELQEYIEVVNPKTKETRYDWKRIGWYSSIDGVLIGCLKNIGVDEKRVKSNTIKLENFMKETNELYDILKQKLNEFELKGV